MVKKWITRVLLLGIVVFAMFKTKELFDDFADGTYAHEMLKVNDIYDKNTNSIPDDSVEDEITPQEVVLELSEKTGDDFYLNLSIFDLWESGEYSEGNGLKDEFRARIRYPELVQIDCPVYNINLTDGYTLRICEYTQDESFIRCEYFVGGDIYKASKYAEYFSITLLRLQEEKQLSPGQWARIFWDGIEIIVCTDKWQNYSNEDASDLVSESVTRKSEHKLLDLLLQGNDDEFANAIWNEQIKSGIYSLSIVELNNGNTTYYVSSSEGDDSNSGLSMSMPKKNLDSLSGLSNVNVLIKCGDVFRLSKEFKIGSNCIYAAYGQGERPEINFYRTLSAEFNRLEESENVWEADISCLDISDDQEGISNCNIGQLVLDGVVNWNRYIWLANESPHFSKLSNMGEGTWAVDFQTSKLYLCSSKDPNEMLIEYAPPIVALQGYQTSNTVIKGLEVKGAGYHGCQLMDCSNIELSNCYFNHIGGSLHPRSGTRFGNAIEIWNSANNINVHNNFVSWIFDTCFTHQGTDKQSVVEHVHFTDNVGAHFFWGIEVWGDGYSDNPFTDVSYVGNVLYDNIDVTNPCTPMYVKVTGRPLGLPDDEYVSFRTGYKYHRMSGININNWGTGQTTRVENNIVWNTNRFLVFATNSRGEKVFSALKDNFFYAEGVMKEAGLFRYDKSDSRTYNAEPTFADESNTWSIHMIGEEYDNAAEKDKLEEALDRIAGGGKLE